MKCYERHSAHPWCSVSVCGHYTYRCCYVTLCIFFNYSSCCSALSGFPLDDLLSGFCTGASLVVSCPDSVSSLTKKIDCIEDSAENTHTFPFPA